MPRPADIHRVDELKQQLIQFWYNPDLKLSVQLATYSEKVLSICLCEGQFFRAHHFKVPCMTVYDSFSVTGCLKYRYCVLYL